VVNPLRPTVLTVAALLALPVVGPGLGGRLTLADLTFRLLACLVAATLAVALVEAVLGGSGATRPGAGADVSTGASTPDPGPPGSETGRK
jgi:hypothetical protein